MVGRKKEKMITMPVRSGQKREFFEAVLRLKSCSKAVYRTHVEVALDLTGSYNVFVETDTHLQLK